MNRWLILAALVTVYIVLGVLYESYIHPITILSTLPSAGVGRAARAADLPDRTQRDCADRNHSVDRIVKKNAIMMIDFALEAERKEASAVEAIYQACLLRFRPIMMTTMAALLGGCRWRWAQGRIRIAPAAGHHDRRRTCCQPDADAVHRACRVSLIRSDCVSAAWSADRQSDRGGGVG